MDGLTLPAGWKPGCFKGCPAPSRKRANGNQVDQDPGRTVTGCVTSGVSLHPSQPLLPFCGINHSAFQTSCSGPWRKPGICAAWNLH